MSFRLIPSDLLAMATIALCWMPASGGPGGAIAFPHDYRGWTHVKSALVGSESSLFATEGGIHHIYANSAAMEGCRTGKFPDGAMIVYDLLETVETRGLTVEGTRRRVDVMVKDSHRFSESGGWGFRRFLGYYEAAPISSPASAPQVCFGCHQSQSAHDFVFSTFRK
jgi:hypothetical protein